MEVRILLRQCEIGIGLELLGSFTTLARLLLLTYLRVPFEMGHRVVAMERWVIIRLRGWVLRVQMMSGVVASRSVV